MTALTAVALSGLFAGCSKEMETNGETTAEADIIQTYENAFITRFGQPHENQTWGFGSVAGTRAVFANGNEWAANDRDDCKYKVPPALTEPQMNIVRIYFQNKQGQTMKIQAGRNTLFSRFIRAVLMRQKLAQTLQRNIRLQTVKLISSALTIWITLLQ